MMQIVFVAIGCYLVLGAGGMYLGNKKVDKEVAAKRWLKYGTYVLITGAVIASIVLDFFPFLATLIALAGCFEMIQTKKTGTFSKAMIAYLLIVAGFLFFAFKFSESFQFLLYFQVLSFDAFCQITGQLVGKTPIAKSISPTKTLEGLIGGIMFCFLSVLLASNSLSIPVGYALIIGSITSGAAFSGDMLASFYKRIAGIKDYSNLLPGQGGFLDRFDSFLMAGFVYSVISIFVPGIRLI